jgi:DNA-binding response OmpR family regulator
MTFLSRQGIGVSATTVALVGLCQEDEVSIRETLACSECPKATECTWKFQSGNNLESALRVSDGNALAVILCDHDRMPEGWKELLEWFAGVPRPPLLIVTSRLADERLWAEALNLGAYDVLCTPFDRNELTRAVTLACSQWWDRYGAPARTVTSAA